MVPTPAVASRHRVHVASLSRVSSEALGQLQPSEKVLAHHTEIGALLGLAETRRSPRVVGVYTAAVVPRGGHRCRPPVRRKARVRGNPRFLVPQRNLPFATFDVDVVKRLPCRFASILAFGPGSRGIRFPSRASVPFRPRFALDLCASRSNDGSLDIHTGDPPGVTTHRVAMPLDRHGRPPTEVSSRCAARGDGPRPRGARIAQPTSRTPKHQGSQPYWLTSDVMCGPDKGLEGLDRCRHQPGLRDPMPLVRSAPPRCRHQDKRSFARRGRSTTDRRTVTRCTAFACSLEADLLLRRAPGVPRRPPKCPPRMPNPSSTRTSQHTH